MKTSEQVLVTIAGVLLLSTGLVAQENNSVSRNLALTPPMGWNSWNKFACNVSEDMIRSMADAMVKSGMKDAGYEYVNIDDCWQVSRDATGNIVADPQRFPHGMKAVGDYIHSLGLKFGVYSDAGSKTCAGRPGGADIEPVLNVPSCSNQLRGPGPTRGTIKRTLSKGISLYVTLER